MLGEAVDCHMLLRMIGEIKVPRDRFRCFLSSFSTSRRCSRNRSPTGLPFLPKYHFLQRVQVMQYETALAEVQVK